jgi:hypothetical protein
MSSLKAAARQASMPATSTGAHLGQPGRGGDPGEFEGRALARPAIGKG